MTLRESSTATTETSGGPIRPLFTDTHVHFYATGHESLRYEWLVADVPVDDDLGDYSAICARRYWPDDFVRETRFQRVGRVVHVQAALGTSDPVEETRWLHAHAARTGVPHGIVAYCDLAAADAGEVLERHVRASPLVRGIRDHRHDAYLTDARWRHGYARLATLGLVACADPPLEQLTLARNLALEHPDVTLCIDHAGMPRRRDDEYFASWREGMATVASAPNTVVKISGLGMCDHTWTVASLRGWVLTCIELWGVERSFFGTNWPIDRLFSSYGDVLAAYDDIVSDFSADEREALFHGTADRVFGLL